MRSIRIGLRRSATATILSIVVFNLICYICIGLPLAVVPPFVTHVLGFNAIVAGLAVSLQYLATFISRPQAGRMADTLGPKRSVVLGAAVTSASGLLLLLAGLAHDSPVLSLTLLLGSRLLLGAAESFTSTGVIMWCIRRTGSHNTAASISWNGMTTYGGMALGAPLGVALSGNSAGHGGLAILGALAMALGVASFVMASRRRPVAVLRGERIPFGAVLWRVTPFGTALALAGTGFGVIAAFITLFFAAKGWNGAAPTLSVFGITFIATRLLFARAINTHGGFKVSLVSLAVETAGLVLLWLAASPLMAMMGSALTGIGFALIFPALGVEAVGKVGPENRGAALGAYSVFLDVSLAISGPLDGLIAGQAGYPAAFLFAALCCVGAWLLTAALLARQRTAVAPRGPKTRDRRREAEP